MTVIGTYVPNIGLMTAFPQFSQSSATFFGTENLAAMSGTSSLMVCAILYNFNFVPVTPRLLPNSLISNLRSKLR